MNHYYSAYRDWHSVCDEDELPNIPNNIYDYNNFSVEVCAEYPETVEEYENRVNFSSTPDDDWIDDIF